MSTSFFSQLWYRVATLKPALKPNLEIALHSYRGAPWYVIRDPMTGKVHRFTAASYALIGAMTGSATLQDIWQASVTRLGAAAPSQDDVVQLLMQLNQSDLLLVDSVPIADELIERMERQRGQKRAKFWKNPMAVPLPLFDPDRLLEALSPLVRGPMGWVWAALWFALIGTVLAVLPSQWAALTATGIREVLALQNLVILACVYPVVKLLHELAHGLVAKRYGAEVHEVGVMFLVFFPVPYVDASASAAFPEKGQRALVGAAGILAELAMAALALFVWVAAEPGLVRDVAFNVMLISGFSTLIVNGNPLLKFD
ncbi:MAG: site-2 protease family protein, partial [Pseudomonadota bacterium]